LKPVPAARIAYLGSGGKVLDLDGLDGGIAAYVEVLWSAGIETYESCEGGNGHSYPEPAVRFFGDRSEGFRALAVAVQHGLPVRAIRRFWSVDKTGEPTGPYWEIAFRERATGLARYSDHSADDSLGRGCDVRA
jgi:hypothetical protein